MSRYFTILLEQLFLLIREGLRGKNRAEISVIVSSLSSSEGALGHNKGWLVLTLMSTFCLPGSIVGKLSKMGEV